MPYTNKQVDVLKDASPVSYNDAVVFAADFDKSVKSVISKVQSLGLPYIKKVVTPKRPSPLTKVQLVDLIAYNIGADLKGLAGATAASLTALLGAVS